MPSGIGLFPPPGTDPIKVGIVVPDDFELPEGYLRHYQVTDDGQELEPILLFHPDYELLDDARQAAAVAARPRGAARARAAGPADPDGRGARAAAGKRALSSDARACSASFSSTARALASGAALALCGLMQRPWFALIFVALVPWLAALDGARSLRGALGCRARDVARVRRLRVRLVRGRHRRLHRARRSGSRGSCCCCSRRCSSRSSSCSQPFAGSRGARGVRSWRSPARSRWVGAEWALPKLFADSLGHGLLPAPWLRQAAELAGAGGLTLVVLLVNECALAALRALAARRPRAALAPAALAAALVGALALYGALRLRALEAEIARAPHVSAGIVQADIARYGELARAVGSFDAVARDPRGALRALARGARAARRSTC